MTKIRKDVLYPSLLLLFHLAGMSTILTMPLDFAWGDTGLKSPLGFLRNSLLHFHQIPLWNDFSATVFAESPISFLYYPPFWLASLLSKNQEVGLRFLTTLHFVFWGPAAYFCFRYGLRLSSLPTFLAAGGLAFSPLFVPGLINGTHIDILTFPFLLLSLGFFLRGYFQEDGAALKNTFLAGALLGVMFLAAGSFLFLYAILFYFLLLVCGTCYSLFLEKPCPIKKIFKRWLMATWLILVCTATAAINLIPSYFFMNHQTGRFLQNYEEMIGQIVPLLFYWNDFLYGYPFPIDGLFLASGIVAVISWKNYFQEKYFLLITLFFLFCWITWGRAAPIDLYYWIYQYFPGFKNNHDTTRFILLVHLCFFALVGMTAEKIFVKVSSPKWKKGILLLVFFILGVCAWDKAYHLWYFYHTSYQAPSPATETDNFLRQKIKEDKSLYPKFRLNLYHAFRPLHELMDNHIQIFPTSEASSGGAPILVLSKFYEWNPLGAQYRFRLLGLLNVRYLTSGTLPIPYPEKNVSLFDTNHLKKIASFSDGTVYENEACLSRVIFPQKAVVFQAAPEERLSFEKLLRLRHQIFEKERDFNQEIFLYGEINPSQFKGFPLPENSPAKKPRKKPEIKKQVFTPNWIELEIENPSSEGRFLYLGDPYAPHWQASVNGKPTPVFLANGVGRGIWLEPAERYQVRFEYQIPHFNKWAALTFLMLGITIGVGVALYRSSKTN